MNQDEWNEWKDWYRESVREWKERYRKTLQEWRERFRDWKGQARTSMSEGRSPPLLPPMPPIPPLHSLSTGRTNVVASRIGDEELKLIDMLIEAGLFGTRSEAVAYLVSEGIKARQDVFDKVSSSLEEIRKIMKEAEGHVEKLKREIGLAKPEGTDETEEGAKSCSACGKDLSDLPEGISSCPYCGTKLEKE
jgi:Arc/MetJ-type ribon-helix-helix transcriptional regulator